RSDMSESRLPAPDHRPPQEPANATPEAGGRKPVAGKAPRWAWWVATGFGSGYLKPAPGTWGSLAALAFWCLLIGVPGFLSDAPHLNIAIPIVLLLAPVITALAIHASNLVVDETGLKDPSFIVADEWAGLWIAMLPSACFAYGASYGIRNLGDSYWTLALPIAVPFFLFRLFDIWKPWPCFQLQSLSRGWGVVADDVMAGLYAAVITAIAMHWFPAGKG
ncbi:MAG TPA: phosphatidylglycerophosphatase A, partial [Holophagaceae bacterium]|nr:phosphatidylglycerophosphatase A [Holophagaceae bacterium]